MILRSLLIVATPYYVAQNIYDPLIHTFIHIRARTRTPTLWAHPTHKRGSPSQITNMESHKTYMIHAYIHSDISAHEPECPSYPRTGKPIPHHWDRVAQNIYDKRIPTFRHIRENQSAHPTHKRGSPPKTTGIASRKT